MTGLKDPSKVKVGDTVTLVDGGCDEPLPGYRDVKPMVYTGLFPIEADQYEELKDALAKLSLNDPALVYEAENSHALGFGFRVGFLGLLHMEVVKERLEREFGLDLLATAPSVEYHVFKTDGEMLSLHSPQDMPDASEIDHIEEPYLKSKILIPPDYVGAVMELTVARRGEFKTMNYLNTNTVEMLWEMPLSELIMDYFDKLNAIDCITLSGKKQSDWYIQRAKDAMDSGALVYAGKYSEPDYELILSQGCDLAVENTMIYHSPAVLEQLERLGIPVLVETSSYETQPLGRMEWIKLYAALLDKEDEAEALFNEKMDSVADVLEQQPTGKTVAFFYITSSGAVNVRKSTDYVAKCVTIAGGDYVSFDESAEDNAQSTINIQMESFYHGAVDADVLIYNSIIDGELHTLDELVALDPLMADFKAVKSGNVWCLTKNFYQESLELSDLILDVNHALNDAPDTAFHFLTRMK